MAKSHSLNGNHHYELALHLAESGIHTGIPFTLFAEVETDPLKNENGKFVKRRYLGKLGSQETPVWFEITDAASTGKDPL